MLRFGLWSIGGQPVAVQIWVVTAGRATVLKLAHDEAFKAHSPGTVLTALMLRHLLDQEHVTEIDFGRGDDAYKKDWAAQRRQRIGLLLVNPWRPSGMAALLRHAAGRARLAMRLMPRPGLTVPRGNVPYTVMARLVRATYFSTLPRQMAPDKGHDDVARSVAFPVGLKPGRRRSPGTATVRAVCAGGGAPQRRQRLQTAPRSTAARGYSATSTR